MAPDPAVVPTQLTTRRKWLRPALSAAVSLVIIVGIFWYFIPQFTSMSKVWSEIQAMTWLEITTLALAGVWNLATYLFVMVGATPGLTYRQAFVATETPTAVSNTLPGGGAIGIALTYSMFGSMGIFAFAHIRLASRCRDLEQLVKLGMPVLALSSC